LTLAMIGSPLLWIVFMLVVFALLAIDLGVFHRRAHAIRFKEALLWSACWIGLSLAFNAWIYFHFGPRTGLEFLTGYLIEYALSVDNIFVFLVIFSYFGVHPAYQHRVLFWGILGALLLRGLFILAGATLIARFHWIIYLFGAFLVYTGVRLLRHEETEIRPEHNPVLRLFRRFVPLTPDFVGQRFLVRLDGRLLATPLLLVLVVVEATDVAFATDSIPAIFAITRDPFIVFTSNICAILGLRSLYFLLASLMFRFRYLNVGLGLVLAFVGMKMLASEIVEVPTGLSLGIIVLLLGGSIVVSWLRPGVAAISPPDDPPNGGPADRT
jgi:TerC family integral membrane protein